MLLVVAAGFWLLATLLHLASLALVARRLRAALVPIPRRASGALVSIIRPVKGLEYDLGDTLRSGFALHDSAYELIFCAHDPADPAVALVRTLMAEHPHIPATLLIGDTQISGNPKLDNIAKAWPAARGEWLVFSDGNIILPADYLTCLSAAWRSSTGAVTVTHIGIRPAGIGAEIECALLNQFQARWHMFCAAMGLSFAHGKTMLVRRSDLAAAGGIEALASEIAEDVALTRMVWATGRTIEPLYRPMAQPLGPRSLAAVWQRQVRWARLRRTCYPYGFIFEIFAGCLLPAVAVGGLAYLLGGSPGIAIIAQMMLWYGSEWAFLRLVGWHASWLTIPAAIFRDLLIPVIWFQAWLGREFRWGERIVYEKSRQPPGNGSSARSEGRD